MTNEIDREARGNPTEAEPAQRQENLDGIQRARKRVYRPGWVVVCAILIALVSLAWIWNGAKILSEMSQVNWTSWAASLGMDAGSLKEYVALQSYFSLAAGILLLVADVGIWTMKKWGTVVYLLVTVLLALGQVFAVSQGRVEFGTLLFAASLIAIGVGLIRLWRQGELT